VTLPPWDYLFLSFNSHNFPDLFRPTWVGALLLLGALVVLYNLRTRALHRHPPYLDMWEWLLWTGVIVFSLLIVFSLFVWDFLFVLVTLVGGAAMFVWIRFVHFPPMFEAYERKMAKERYFTRSKFSHPEATIRSKSTKRRRR
jgi:hypothetical protein